MGRGYAKLQNWKKAIVTLSEGDEIQFFDRDGGELSHGYQDLQADLARAPLLLGLATSRRSPRPTPGARRCLEHQTSHRRPQPLRPHHQRASAAVVTSSATASSTSSATRSACPPTVASIEYDPNRTARIALLHYADGEKRYILAPDGLKVGDTIVSSRNADIKPGNSLPLALHPARHDDPQHRAARRARAGSSFAPPASRAQLMAKDGDYAQVRLPSGEVRKVHLDCRATIGQVSNVDHANITLGKAGRTRWLGRRPHNRGVTMNPVDHPMGGGEGRTQRRSSPVLAVGSALQGSQDAQQQAHRRR